MQPNLALVLGRLQRFAPLSPEEKRAFEAACGPAHELLARSTLVAEGAAAARMNVILEGFACRYRLHPDGRRQIVGLLLPGDMSDLRICFLRHMDHSVSALSRLRVTQISRDQTEALLERYPRLSRAFWCSTLVEESITRQWLLNVGHRTAFERMAHLFCEIFARLRAVGLTRGRICDLPLTQSELSDALALSAVHVNRVIMEMRRADLITLSHQQLTLHDFEALQSVAGFDERYLHLEAAAEPRAESRPRGG